MISKGLTEAKAGFYGVSDGEGCRCEYRRRLDTSVVHTVNYADRNVFFRKHVLREISSIYATGIVRSQE